MKLKNFAFALVFLCLAFALNAKAQFDITATIQGQVIRGNNRGIRNAEVKVLNLTTLDSEIHRTNDFGYFRFNDLPVGNLYYVTVKARNFDFPYLYGSFHLWTPVQEITFVAAD